MTIRRFSPYAAVSVFLLAFFVTETLKAQDVETEITRHVEALLTDVQAGERLRAFCDSLTDPEIDPDLRTRAERALCAKLSETENDSVKIRLIALLAKIGFVEAVDALRAQIPAENPRIEDAVLSALAIIPEKEAGDCLRNMLSSTIESDRRIAILNALTFREEPETVAVVLEELPVRITPPTQEEIREQLFAKLQAEYEGAAQGKPKEVFHEELRKKDPLQHAMLQCVARSGGSESIELLKQIHAASSAVERKRYSPYLLECAGKLLEGVRVRNLPREREALAIYQRLASSEETPLVRFAAFGGIVRITTRSGNAEYLLFLLRNIETDPRFGDIALAGFWDMEPPLGKEIPREVFFHLPEEMKLRLLYLFGEKRDESSRPLLDLALTDSNMTLRIAAFRALGGVGGEDALPLLMRRYSEELEKRSAAPQEKPSPLEESLRDALEKSVLPDTEEAIRGAIHTAKTSLEREAYLRLAVVRKSGFFLELFQEFITHQDASSCALAAEGLASLGTEEELPRLEQAIFVTQRGPNRETLEKAYVTLFLRYNSRETLQKHVLNLYENAQASQRSALMGLLSRIGGEKAYEIVLETIRDGDASSREAAFFALVHWPESRAEEELYRLATQLPHEGMAAAALQGYIRLITAENERPVEESIALFQKAIEAAKRPREINELLVKSVTDSRRSVELFDFLCSYLENPLTSDAAAEALLNLVSDTNFHREHRERIVPVLDKILRTSERRSLYERAGAYLDKAP